MTNTTRLLELIYEYSDPELPAANSGHARRRHAIVLAAARVLVDDYDPTDRDDDLDPDQLALPDWVTAVSDGTKRRDDLARRRDVADASAWLTARLKR